MLQKRKNKKRQKNTERYRLSVHFHHPPLKKFDFKDNFFKKVSLDATKSFDWGVGVWKCDQNQILESSNILY